MPKVVNGFSWKFVCTMGMGPRTNLYRIGGDPLTQLKKKNFFFVCFKRKADSDTINGKDVVGDPLTQLKACAQRFRYALFAFIHTQTYFEYYTLTLRLASLVKKAVIYAYWTKELFDICRENVSHKIFCIMATLPSVVRHVIHADNLRPRH